MCETNILFGKTFRFCSVNRSAGEYLKLPFCHHVSWSRIHQNIDSKSLEVLPEPFCVKYVRPLFTVMTVLYSEHWVRKLWQCCHLVFRIHGWAISWRCYLGFYLLKRQHLNWSYLRAFRSHICTIHLFVFPSFLHVVFWCVCVCIWSKFCPTFSFITNWMQFHSISQIQMIK